MKTERNLTLAMETAIYGGSLSILDERREIDFWIGDREISKSEDVLENIEKLLKKNDLDKKEIQTVIVSAKAGSATGLAIGTATAKGLSKALGCRLAIVSLTQALYESGGQSSFETIIALPVGKNNIACQTFLEGEMKSAAATFDLKAFAEFLNKIQPDQRLRILAHPVIIKALLQNQADVHYSEILLSIGENLAKIIGKSQMSLIMN